MEMFIYLYAAIAAVFGGLVGTPGAAPSGPGGLAAPSAIVATLSPSCTEAVPVPTVTAEVTNHGAAALSATVHRDEAEVAVLYVAPGQSESVSATSPHWEDVDNVFEIRDDGEVLASLEHSFDCLHPVLDVTISSPCVDGAVTVEVSNSGHEGTHVTITSDGAVVAEPPVAPGHTAVVDVAIDDGQVLEVHHHGEVLVSTVIDCDAPGDDPGDDPVIDGYDPPGPTLSEDDSRGGSLEEVPDDGPDSVGSDDGRDPVLTSPDAQPVPRPVRGS